MQIVWRDEMLGLFETARRARWAAALATASMLCWASAARALVIAADNASQAAYSDGWQAGDNGGSGFNAWSTIGRENGSGFGGGFLSTSNGNVNIGSGGNNAAFGVFGNGGGIGQAIRPFSSPLQVAWTFAIDMDNQGIDTGGTVGFSLRNASGANLAEFYFTGGQTNYTVNAQNVSGSTPGFTSGGLHLTFMLNTSNMFTMTVDTLANGVGVDNTVTGNLLANANQGVAQLRLFNANGGADVFYNNLSISVVPEAPPLLLGAAVCAVVGIVSAFQGMFKRQCVLVLNQLTPTKTRAT